MNNLIIGTLVYNEEHKFLNQYLNKVKQLTDKIVLIDDGSTDNSLSICQKYSSYIYQTDRMFIKNESMLRQNLWDKCTQLCNDKDYIFILDCDELLTQNSIDNFKEMLEICDKLDGDAISFNFYDMWNKTQYREEYPYWTASLHHWVRCVKYRKNYNYYWNNKKMHCGAFPINTYFSVLPTIMQIQHMSYSTIELRKQKRKFYEQYDPNGEYYQSAKQQYDSILSENPILKDFKDNFDEYNKHFEYWKN